MYRFYTRQCSKNITDYSFTYIYIYIYIYYSVGKKVLIWGKIWDILPQMRNIVWVWV